MHISASQAAAPPGLGLAGWGRPRAPWCGDSLDTLVLKRVLGSGQPGRRWWNILLTSKPWFKGKSRRIPLLWFPRRGPPGASVWKCRCTLSPKPRAGCAPHSPVGALRLRPLLSEEHGSSPLPRLMVFSPAEATAQRTALGASVQEETGDRLAGLALSASSSRPLQGSRRWLSPCCGAPLACVLWSIPSPLQLGPPETLGRGMQAILAENPAQTNRVRERIPLQCVAGSCFASDALSLPVPGPQPPTLTIFLTSCPGSWGLGFSRLLPGVPWPLRLRQHRELSSEG